MSRPHERVRQIEDDIIPTARRDELLKGRLLQSLCGADDSLWEAAEQAAVDCLTARCELWDGICDVISIKDASIV